MNGCQKARLQMSRKLDGVLPPAEDAALQAHLSACPACRTVWEQLCALQQCLREPEPVPETLHGAVMARIAQARQEPAQDPPQSRRARRRPWIPALAGVAACGVLVVGAARFGLFRGAFSAENLSWSTGMAMAPSAADRDDDKSGSAGMDGFWPEENMDALAPSPEMPAEPPETADRETASPESQQKSSAASGADYLAQGRRRPCLCGRRRCCSRQRRGKAMNGWRWSRKSWKPLQQSFPNGALPSKPCGSRRRRGR